MGIRSGVSDEGRSVEENPQTGKSNHGSWAAAGREKEQSTGRALEFARDSLPTVLDI